ncbi:cytochrome P450 [Coprinopsis sp. MPI-PUGE-AT-0042]|nr:cytochrome P450 [Coprinopsis sp. MPI-PUGE-AT-0042]
MGSLAPVLIVLIVSVVATLWLKRPRLPLPPGPSVRELDLKKMHKHRWVTWAEWKATYGPISSFTTFGHTSVVLNSAKAMADLLESNSVTTSDRPKRWMGVLAGTGANVFTMSSQKPWFKIYRRLLQGGLNSRACKDYRAIIQQETNTALKCLATDPGDFRYALHRASVAVMLKLAYGFQIGGRDDKFVDAIDDTMHIIGELSTPGRYFVEVFPILRFLPSWFPGAGFKRHAKAMGVKMARTNKAPFIWAQKKIATGKHVENFISKLMHSETPYIPTGEKDDVIRWCSAALYVGGGETTVSALATFMLLMQLYPNVQKRLQTDLDRVAPGRLPTFDDYQDLPYFAAVIKEVLRWGQVAPTGLPHVNTQDMIYEGYLIPKGTRLWANIWAVTHDEELYPEPFRFNPERHLGPNPQPNPFQFIFGFGRRVCPGAHFAETSIFYTISNILAVFNISKQVDESGNEIEPQIAWTSGVTSHPEPFTCKITCRNKELLSIIMDQEDPVPDIMDLEAS